MYGAVPRLIHVNGPPGIGKSTPADLYVKRHPGALNLDVDRLHELVGGWQDPAQPFGVAETTRLLLARPPGTSD